MSGQAWLVVEGTIVYFLYPETKGPTLEELAYRKSYKIAPFLLCDNTVNSDLITPQSLSSRLRNYTTTTTRRTSQKRGAKSYNQLLKE
jgi:hypothetical protein